MPGPIDLNEAGNEIVFSYRRAGNEGPYGFKLEGTVIKSLLGPGWQDLTDGNVMSVTDFKVTPVRKIPRFHRSRSPAPGCAPTAPRTAGRS